MSILQRPFYWRVLLTLICLFTIMVATLMATRSVFAAPRATGDYGAIAYSKSLKESFTSIEDNKLLAEDRAWDWCMQTVVKAGSGYKNDCDVAVWVHNGWMSTAVGDNGAWGTGWGSTQTKAEKEAVKVCEDNGGTNCTPTGAWGRNPQQSAKGGIGFRIVVIRLPWVSGSYKIDKGYSYGCGTHKDNPGTKYRDSFAIDFRLPEGTHVAALTGGIAHTGDDGATTNYGNYIWIAHTGPDGSFNGLVSVYAHLGSFNITDGQRVAQGDWIGNADSTGNSTASHLHFSLRMGFDETHLSSAEPVRPEPMSGYTGFGHYGITQDKGCDVNNPVPSPDYTQ